MLKMIEKGITYTVHHQYEGIIGNSGMNRLQAFGKLGEDDLQTLFSKI